jgi:hypothetical protein
VGRKILHEAIISYISKVEPSQERSGFMLQKSSVEEIESMIMDLEKLPINSVSQEMIDSLPMMRSNVAKTIVDERATHGPFNSIEEVEKRVSGFGRISTKRFRHAFWFDTLTDRHQTLVKLGQDFHQDLNRFVRLQKGEDELAKLINGMMLLVSYTAGEPHPVKIQKRHRSFEDRVEDEMQGASWIGILANSEYFQILPILLSSATGRVDVCMFHIAFPEESHPSRQLLDALIEAHDKGAVVRVLVDRDRPNDPYLSTVINTPAKNYLDQHGISCKFDTEDRLLHSKYVIIDNETTVIGSHNWSAGSFFHFDDLSLVVRSEEFTTIISERFESLWQSAL